MEDEFIAKRLGATHRHYKGGYYKFICCSEHTETGEEVVVYEHIWPNEPKIWIRPKKMFFDFVLNGIRRFTPICGYIEKLEDKTLRMSKNPASLNLLDRLDDLLSVESNLSPQEDNEIWKVHPSQLAQMKMTRKEFIQAHIEAAILQATKEKEPYKFALADLAAS